MFFFETVTSCFDTKHLDLFVVEKRMEQANRVRSSANCRYQQIGQAIDTRQHLRARFLADDALEIANKFGIWVWARGSADDVECIVDIGDPVAQPFVHGILQRACTARDRNDFRAQQTHAEHIWLLPFNVLRTHVNKARQAKACANSGRRNAMLASTCFCDDPRFAHTNGKQNLANAVVDLVRTSVVQFVALEPDLRAFARWRVLAHFIGQALGIIKRRGATDIMFKQIVKLRSKSRVLFCGAVFAFKVEHERHKRFGHIAPAELAKMATFVRLVTE